MTPCQATRRDGQRCHTPVVADSCFCFAHEPRLADKRTQARQRGGTNKANHLRLQKLMPASLAPVFDQLAQVLTDVIADRIDPKNAAAAASVARAMVAVLERGEMEQRLRTLEERSA
jgi:hypothetical protein